MKILLIGIDGASWKVIDPLVKSGGLPAFEALMRQGASGKLLSIRDSVSPAIWTTIATGKLPRKHGICAPTRFDARSGKEIPCRSGDRKAKAVWNILDEGGRDVGVFNWLASYPPEHLGGYFVSDYYLSGSADLPAVHPRTLEKPIREAVETLEQDRRTAQVTPHQLKLMQDIAVSVRLYRDHRPDLCMVYTFQTDVIQHLYWKYREPEHYGAAGWGVTREGIERYGDAIRESYLRVDGWIAELRAAADGDTIIIVVSDHGFKRMEKPYTPLSFRGILEKLEVHDPVMAYWCCDGKDWTYISADLPPERLAAIVGDIRRPDGEILFRIVPSDKAEFGAALIQTDTAIAPGGEIVIGGKKYRAEEFFIRNNDISGAHDFEDGIIIMAGKGIREGCTIPAAAVADIAPTILHLFGLPVAGDMDGKVIGAALEKGFPGNRPVRFVDTYERGGNARVSCGGTLTPAEEKKLRELKGLGYIQ